RCARLWPNAASRSICPKFPGSPPERTARTAENRPTPARPDFGRFRPSRRPPLQNPLLEELVDVLPGHDIETRIGDLLDLLPLLEREQDIHRQLAHFERSLADQAVNISVAQRLELDRQRV